MSGSAVAGRALRRYLRVVARESPTTAVGQRARGPPFCSVPCRSPRSLGGVISARSRLFGTRRLLGRDLRSCRVSCSSRDAGRCSVRRPRSPSCVVERGERIVGHLIWRGCRPESIQQTSGSRVRIICFEIRLERSDGPQSRGASIHRFPFPLRPQFRVDLHYLEREVLCWGCLVVCCLGLSKGETHLRRDFSCGFRRADASLPHDDDASVL